MAIFLLCTIAWKWEIRSPVPYFKMFFKYFIKRFPYTSFCDLLIFLTPLWGEQGSYFSHFYSREYWGTNKLYSFLKVIQLCRAGTCDHSLICSLIHTASFSHIKYLWDGNSLAKPYASWWRCSEHIVHFFKELMLQSGKLTKKETVFGVGGWERLRATRHSDKCCHMPKH